MKTFSFVLCTNLLLMSSVVQLCQGQQFLFGPALNTTTRTTTTRSKDKAVTIPPMTTPITMPMPTSSRPTNTTIGMETESNITLGNNALTCSQVVNITTNNTALYFRIPRRNATIHCVITIHGPRNQHLILQIRNISIQSGMQDCEQGSIQLYTLKQGLLYFRNKSCNSTQPSPQLKTDNNAAVLTVTSDSSNREQGFELEVQTIDTNNTDSYGYPYPHYGHSGTSFGLPSIAYVPGATLDTQNYSYEAPSVNYGLPHESYGPPRPTYGPPSVTYGPPSVTYGPPSATYGTPSVTYGPPSVTYGPPRPTYGSPSATYGPPSATYGPPSATYSPPSATYGPPSATYGPPRATYGPPSATYGPPSATYGVPNATHGPPVVTYGPPSAPGYHRSPYNPGNHSGFLSYFIGENQYLGESIDRHGYDSSTPPEYDHNAHNYDANPNQQSPTSHGGYGHHCENDCDKQPWKVINSVPHQSDTYYNPYSSPLYAWLTSDTKPKYWSNELH